jgi:hypothetical protein
VSAAHAAAAPLPQTLASKRILSAPVVATSGEEAKVCVRRCVCHVRSRGRSTLPLWHHAAPQQLQHHAHGVEANAAAGAARGAVTQGCVCLPLFGQAPSGAHWPQDKALAGNHLILGFLDVRDVVSSFIAGVLCLLRAWRACVRCAHARACSGGMALPPDHRDARCLHCRTMPIAQTRSQTWRTAAARPSRR